MTDLQLWKGPDGALIPTDISEAQDLVKYAESLTERQRLQIVAAFEIKAYDMAAEFTWKKAIVKLKETLSTLGMKFIGEMLNREDIDEYATLDQVLTDYTTINLAEQLGVVSSTAALKLKHANELITHYFSNKASEDLDKVSAMQIVKSSVQYVLAESDISIAIEFSQFRNRLLSEYLSLTDIELDQLIHAPLFYLRTVVTILTSAIKNDTGAKLENALANFNLILPHIWSTLGENDKWNIGTAYRDVTASGNVSASSGLKNALLKVRGFDYVPENLRSNTFKKAASNLLEVHFGQNNFYNEPAAIKRLANLGSTIPSAAFLECLQAYIAIYIGNYFNYSWAAAEIAERKLSEISNDRWRYYYEKGINTDEIILSKLTDLKPFSRFRTILQRFNAEEFDDLPKVNRELLKAVLANNYTRAKNIAEAMLRAIKPKQD